MIHSSTFEKHGNTETGPLRGKFQNMEFFLVGIFLYSDQKKLRICSLFTKWALISKSVLIAFKNWSNTSDFHVF